MPFRLSNPILPVAVVLCLGLLPACKREQPPPIAPVTVVEQPRLAALGKMPDWSVLEKYQGTISREEFTRRLEEVYALPGASSTTVFVGEDRVKIRRQSIRPMMDEEGMLVLHFGNAAPPPTSWRRRDDLPPLTDSTRPLLGVRIALDPGHIGGKWAAMEERNFVPVTGPAVQEGSLSLQTARLLRTLLEELGADVALVRDREEPITPLRPGNLVSEARAELLTIGIDPDHPPDASPMNTVRWQSEKLFYRNAEIRARAERVNQTLHPDLVICLHFNASGSWGRPGVPVYAEDNHLHLLVNGGYALDELILDDQRQEMLLRLLSGVHGEEIALAGHVATSLAAATGLPPFTYHANALPVAGNPYVWCRNLLANRLYACPVVYCEPYVMNNREVCARLQEGDYYGERLIAGRMVGSIFREYARAVAEGLKAYFSQRK